MNPRERVLAALAHSESDRVPLDLGGSSTTGIAASTYRAVREQLHLEPEDVAIIDPVQQLAHVSDDLLVHLGIDTRAVQVPREDVPRPAVFRDGNDLAYVDRWGITLRMPAGGHYFDRVAFPILEASLSGLQAYDWPPPLEPHPSLRARALALRNASEYAVIGGSYLGIGGIFEQAWKLVGMEDALMGMLTDRPFAERLLDGVTEAYIEAIERYLDLVGDCIDVFTFADDICSQSSWIISPELYVSLIKPRQRRLFEAVRAKTSARISYHGCGAVFDLIPHLIDIGVEVLNPVQVSARGMDPASLKATYGASITFWGGGVDTQSVLPFGTPDQVSDEVKRRIDAFAPGGGFVFAPVHNIQALVPPENVIAAYEAAMSFGWR